jgi:polyphosphate kinase
VLFRSLNPLIDQADAPALRFAPHEPERRSDQPEQRSAQPERRAHPPGRRSSPPAPRPGQSAVPSIFERLAAADVLLHHPFESFDLVIEFLREAVRDPAVLAIRQTIYRTGEESELMELLIAAARRGKAVMAVVELQARFDEEANINWAERLEAAGAQVVYGIAGLKTHAKLLVVTRREQRRLRRYVHLSTGNYNPRTARLYTDLGVLSADPALAADADAVFRHLAGQTRARARRRLVSAPFGLHQRLLAHIAQVTDAARRGAPARIVVKVNGLTEPALIDALMACGRAGARIDLIVRGACLLRPGVPGHGETIRVRSIVGRFLEHSRVFYFRWGEGDDDEALYLSSADWMSRNLFRRVEVAWNLTDAGLRQRVIDEALVPYLHDELDAWELDAEGRYHRVADRCAGGRGESHGLSAQQALMQRYAR